MPATETPAKGKSEKSDKVKNKYAGLSYFDMLAEAEKPIEDRKLLPIGRGGKESVMRRHHVLDDELAPLRQQFKDGDVFPNPHNRGCYFYIWEALKTLGLNEWHLFRDVVKELRRSMSAAATKDDKGATAWERFRDKKSRSKTGRDVDGRILQNIEVLQRITGLNAYGIKQNQIAQRVVKDKDGNYLKGACFDIKRDDEKSPVFIRFNTKPEQFLSFDSKSGRVRIAVPRNDLKLRRKLKVKVVKAAKAKAKVAKKVKQPKVAEEVQPVANAVPVTVDVRHQEPEVAVTAESLDENVAGAEQLDVAQETQE